VLLPQEYIPLHIFEERYKDLIEECLDTEGEFVIVYADDEGMRALGTRARVVRVIERYPDGRLDIIVKGGGRARIERRTEGRAFPTAEVSPVGDEIDSGVAPELEGCLASYRRLLAAAEVDEEQPELEPGSAAFGLAGRVALDVEAKQDLLELTSEKERLIRLTGWFEELAEAMRRRRAIRRRAGGDGRVDDL
jgi:Lon protease-like protein